jgi:hypothetical protein
LGDCHGNQAQAGGVRVMSQLWLGSVHAHSPLVPSDVPDGHTQAPVPESY